MLPADQTIIDYTSFSLAAPASSQTVSLVISRSHSHRSGASIDPIGKFRPAGWIARKSEMAKACRSAVVLVCVVLAVSLCVADAGPVSDRKLLQTGAVLPCLELHFDATAVSVDVGAATASLAGVTVALKAGKVCKLSAANVQVWDGAVYVRVCILGADKVVALNLAMLKPTVRDGKVEAVVVLVLDEAESLMHLRSLGGERAAIPALGVHLPITLPL